MWIIGILLASNISDVAKGLGGGGNPITNNHIKNSSQAYQLVTDMYPKLLLFVTPQSVTKCTSR